MNIEQIKNKFQDILLKLQAKSSKDTLQKFVFLLDPKQKLLCKGVVAWKNIKVQIDFSNYKELENELDFIWQFARIDIKAFCTILQINQGEAISLINRLKSLNLIFPDGTVNSTAYNVLITFSKNQVEKKTGIKKKAQNKNG